MSSLPLWKKWLSYLGEVHIESVPSEINPELRLSVVKGRFQLSSVRSIYSFDDYYLNFLVAFKKIQIERLSISRVLMLGLGLGSVPYILEKKFNLFPEYTIVDVDEAIIYLASKYTLPRIRSSVQIVHADAWSFVKLHEGTPYDLIIVDLFVDDKIPLVFESTGFLEGLLKMAGHNTLLLINRLYRTGADRQMTDRYFKEVFQKAFKNNELIPVAGNSILKAWLKK